MLQRTIPTAVKLVGWRLGLVGHTRGEAADGAPALVTAGTGSRWAFSATVAPMVTADALRVRAWLHSLRGRSGSAIIRLPTGLVDNLAEDDPRATFITARGGEFILDRSGSYILARDGGRAADGDATGELSASVSAGATSATLVSDNIVRNALLPGNLAVFGDPTTGASQLVRITRPDGDGFYFRPALRAGFASGVTISFGRVYSEWRLASETPVVPLLNSRSDVFTLDLEEVY